MVVQKKNLNKPGIRLTLLLFLISAVIFGLILKLKIIDKKSKTDLIKPAYCKDCNVILISIDTLRAKNMSLYGYGKNTTAEINNLADESLVFKNAVSVAPWTLPSQMSMFTAVYPSKHGVVNKYLVRNNSEEYIANLSDTAPELKTLAQILHENGYKTAGFTGGSGIHSQFGFDLGFDTYIDDKDFAGFSYTSAKALEWIEANKSNKFFVFLHGYDVHGQYVPEGGYDFRFLDFEYEGKFTGSKQEQEDLREDGLTRGKIFLNKEDVEFLTALYDEKIQRADEQVGNFINQYKKFDLWDKTIVIVTSDHGEELYEHGRIDHGHSLYEELIRIPLIIKIPGNTQGVKLDNQVSNIDITPTLLEVLRISNEGLNMDGTSVFSLLKNNQERSIFPETDYRYVRFLRSIRTEDGWKLVRDLESEKVELYNIGEDNAEPNNLADDMKDKVNTLKQKLTGH